MKEKPAINLSHFQQWMLQQLLDPNRVSSSNNKNEIPIENMVCDSKRLSARDHLAIYQRSYIARLRDCMSKVFSALEYALGEELFEGFADSYLELHPSSSYNLSDLGAKFPDYLEATRPDADQEVREDWPDFMIELATFEYAINTLFDKEDRSENALASIATKEENLRPIPIMQLFAFRFPIRPFYSAFVNKEAPHLPMQQQSHCAIIRQRHNYRIALYDLQPAQYHFLTQMQSGKSVQEALHYLVVALGVEENQLQTVWQTWKETWIQAGFFMDCLIVK